MVDPIVRLTRDQLARFLPDSRAIKAFEQLMQATGTDLPAEIIQILILLEEISTDTGSNSAKADSALSLIHALRDNSDLTDYSSKIAAVRDEIKKLLEEISYYDKNALYEARIKELDDRLSLIDTAPAIPPEVINAKLSGMANNDVLRYTSGYWLNIPQTSLQAGSVQAALTNGTYITSSGTYDGAVARTFAVDATAVNTASKVVARDGSGDFAAGIVTTGQTKFITATVSGYHTGSGGSVTQLVNKSTGVTLDKPTGQITMNAAALAAGATVSFTLTNSVISQYDVLLCNADNNANYTVACAFTTAGAAGLRVTNITAGSLSEALRINFVILKGVIT